MATWWAQASQLPWWLLGPMAAAIAWIGWRGLLRPEALRGSPSRTLGLGAMDLCIGAGLMLVGMSLAGTLLAQTRDAPLTAHLTAMIAAQFLGLGLPAAYLAARAARETGGLRRIGLLPKRWGRDLKVGLGGAVLALAIVPGAIMLVALIGLAFGQTPPMMAHDLLVTLRETDSTLAVALIAFSAIVLAPLLEEVVYRGLWQSMLVEALGESRRWTALLLASTIWTAMHAGVSWQALPALWVLGLLLGWVYERTASLLPSVLIHVVFNAFNIGYVLLLMPPDPTPGLAR